MITKSALWKAIRKQLLEIERSKSMTVGIMNKIKETPQNENNHEHTKRDD